jgi:TorA maturation chaperone TorD
MNRELLKLKFQGDFTAASHIIQKWLEKSPDNKELKHVTEYLTNSYIYATACEMQIKEANAIINRLREKRDKYKDLSDDYKELYEKLQEKTL